MADTPERIRVMRNEGVLEIQWTPSCCLRYPFKFLRSECPCAGCVNEFTGERTLDPASIPDEISPLTLEFSGNYALKIQWSDGHATGLYSWDRLEALGGAPEVIPVPCETH